MDIDLTIPGWTSESKLIKLAELASNVVENGWIVEVGAYLGRSTYALAKNSHPSVITTAFDIWLSTDPMLNTKKYLRGNFDASQYLCIEEWLSYTKTCENLEYFQVMLPIKSKMVTYAQEADLIFLDACHEKDDKLELLKYFFPLLKKGGILVVDDYSMTAWPGVVEAVDEFLNEYNLQISENIESMVCIVKE